MSADQVSRRRSARPALSDEVADHVRDLIVTGQVHEGDFLRLDRIAAELDVSVTPVREGMMTLQSEGFVTLKARRGFVVRAVSTTDVEDIFWVQAQIEGEISRRATEHFAGEGVDGLWVIQRQLELAAADGDHRDVERFNYDLHHAIAKVVDSPRLRWFLGRAARMSPSRFFPEIPGWSEAAVDDHGAIIEALGSGDGDAAGAAMTAHVMRAGALLVAKLNAAPDRPA